METQDRYILTFDQNQEIALETKQLKIFYGDYQAITAADLQIPRFKITALIGASGSGKSTFLRALNRMNDGIATVHGEIWYRNLDLNTKEIDVYAMRRQIGMVFQRPNPFPKSIYENITFALERHGVTDKKELAKRVEMALRQAALWAEVKDKLNQSALSLSGGQAQRLCIARAIALQPDILLLDEPASALDPISTAQLEETLINLKEHYTIVIVTHNLPQAARISDYTAHFSKGTVIEFNDTKETFTQPRVALTNEYISGDFG